MTPVENTCVKKVIDKTCRGAVILMEEEKDKQVFNSEVKGHNLVVWEGITFAGLREAWPNHNVPVYLKWFKNH